MILCHERATIKPDINAVADHLRGIPFAETSKGEVFLRETTCTDGVMRPWVLVVPASYDPARPTPLLVVLHGGVSQAEVEPDPLAHAARNHLVPIAASRGWLALLPYGQRGATWWDDDRVFMAGVSGGASAGFLHAMVDPDDYGAVAALLGHMGVGSLDGGLDTFAPNFFNTAIYAVTNDRDVLYPSARMRATIEMADRAGGRIFYRERFGVHRTEDILDEPPGVGDWLARHPRDPFPLRVVWETTSARFGRCRWRISRA